MGKRIWLTLRYDIYRNIVRIHLHASQPQMKPDILLYENLQNNQFIRLGQPEWSDSTKITFDDSDIEPKPKRHIKDEKDSNGTTVRVFTLKIANGVH